jgi:hypothetical protein
VGDRDTLSAEVKHLREELSALKGMERPLTESERRAALTIIAAVGKDTYGFNPRRNTSAAQDLVNDIGKFGMSLDVKTARKWLNEAYKLLPDEDDVT